MTKLAMVLMLGMCAMIGGGQQSGFSSKLSSDQIYPASSIGAIYVESGGTSDYDKAAVHVYSHTGRIDRLSDDEYDARQKLVQALHDIDMKTAKAHGVDFGYDPCKAAQTPGAPGYRQGSTSCYADISRAGDTYEYLGQWLLINVPQEAKQ